MGPIFVLKSKSQACWSDEVWHPGSKAATAAAPESEEMKTLRHSITGHKGHLSRALKAADQYVKVPDQQPFHGRPVLKAEL